MAGINSAYLLTDPNNLRFIGRVAEGKEPGVLPQIAAQAALEDTSYTAAYVQQVHESKKMLFETLPRLGYDFRITLVNYFLLRVKNPEKLITTLAKNNIFIKSLSDIEQFENHVRITIGTPSQTGVLLDILGRVAESQALPHEDYAAEPAVNRLNTIDREVIDESAKQDTITFVPK
jgi:histidinol-phosphate/aromatic aminotransferase/cobyric acid decarboxylase-like protein